MFQRTAQWMFPNPNYHGEVGPGVRWALRHLPFYGRWYRFLIFWPGCDKGLEAARVDPDYPDQQTAVSEINEITRHDVHRVDRQPGRRRSRSCSPRWCPTTRRPASARCRTTAAGCARSTRDDVELVRTGIDHIEPDAVVTDDGDALRGRRHRVRHRLPGEQGAVADGRSSVATATDLASVWGERPAAYLGITVPGFPNFFCMYGPGTNLAHGGSLIFHSECQMRYITQCFELLIDGGHRPMEPREDKYDDWHERSQAEMRNDGVVTAVDQALVLQERVRRDPRLSPWRLVDYWTWTREPESRTTSYFA